MHQPESTQGKATTDDAASGQQSEAQTSSSTKTNAQVGAVLQTNAAQQPSTVQATSLSGAQRVPKGGLFALAQQFGFTGDEKAPESEMRDCIIEMMGYEDETPEEAAAENRAPRTAAQQVDVMVLEQSAPEQLYKPAAHQPDMTNLSMPDKLDHEQVKQGAQSGACQGIAPMAGMLLVDPSRLQSLLVSQTPEQATFKFPSAAPLDQFKANSADDTKSAITSIQNAQAQLYQVKKEIHQGDLLPTTEPWANLLLKATHQYISTCKEFANQDGYDPIIALEVKRTPGGATESITFNLLTGQLGTSLSGAAFDKSDDELQGKTLQIGHSGHATVLVVGTDGTKTYYDNQNGVTPVKQPVKEFLSSKGMTTDRTTLVTENSST